MRVGFMILKNGIKLGYPFIEAVASMHQSCDKFLFFDCGSEDGTLEYMRRIHDINKDKFEVYQQSWPKHSSSGNAIAVATNNAMKHKTIANAEKAFYVQADEIYHQNSLPYLKDYMLSKNFKSTSFRFLHFRNSFKHFIKNPSYNRAIRIITPKDTKNIQDGYNFGGNIDPCYNSNVGVFHMGWCFPHNICQKHINHAALYPGHSTYAGAKRLCIDMIKKGKIDRDILINKIDKQYNLEEMPEDKITKYVEHLFRLDKYNPQYSLSVLEEDLK